MIKRLNLAPPPSRRPFITTVAWACCAVVVALAGVQSIAVSSQRSRLEAQRAALAPQVAALEAEAGALRAQVAAAVTAQRALADLRAKGIPYEALFDAMERSAPDELWLQSLNLRPESIRLAGSATGWNGVAAFARALQQRYQATLEGVSREGTAVPVYRFTLTMPPITAVSP